MSIYFNDLTISQKIFKELIQDLKDRHDNFWDSLDSEEQFDIEESWNIIINNALVRWIHENTRQN